MDKKNQVTEAMLGMKNEYPNRGIYFRAKTHDDEEWVSGYLVVVCNRYFIIERQYSPVADEVRHRVIADTVGQYIGRVDKNDVQMCEKDIIRITSGHHEGIVGHIVYTNDGGGNSFSAYNNERGDISGADYDSAVPQEDVLECRHDVIEIIGNTVDNIDLLEMNRAAADA